MDQAAAIVPLMQHALIVSSHFDTMHVSNTYVWDLVMRNMQALLDTQLHYNHSLVSFDWENGTTGETAIPKPAMVTYCIGRNRVQALVAASPPAALWPFVLHRYYCHSHSHNNAQPVVSTGMPSVCFLVLRNGLDKFRNTSLE